MRSQLTAMPARLRDPRLPLVLAAGAGLVSIAVLLSLSRDLTFFLDEWDFLLHRRGFGADVLLDPHNEHIAVLPIAIYKLLLAAFGMDSQRPFQVVSTLMYVLSIALVFVWIRRRVGAWLALAAALPLLFFGASWIDLLFPFQLAFSGSMSCGIGALLCLERNDKTGDRAACALLVASLAFSSLGLPFIVGAAVAVGWDADRRRRAFVVLVPAALYAVWWLGWGHRADNSFSIEHLMTLPTYVFDGLASSLSSLLGLATPRNDTGLTPLVWGRPLLVVALALLGFRIASARRVSRELAVVIAIAASLWALAALNADVLRDPSNGRYQYMGAVFLLFVAAEAARGIRLSRFATAGVLLVSVAATVSNAAALNDGATTQELQGMRERGELAGLEISRDRVAPDLVLDPENSDTGDAIDAGSYLSAVDAFGSPAYSSEQLVDAPEQARGAADRVLVNALGISLTAAGGPAPAGPAPEVIAGRATGGAGAGCVEVSPDPASGLLLVQLPPGGAWIENLRGAGVDLGLHRYSIEGEPVAVGELARGESGALPIPSDRATQPWTLAVSGPALLRVCALRRG